MNNILLSFDVEEFDMPLEYGHKISSMEQMEVGYRGLDAIAPILHEVPTTLFTTANFADHFPEKIKSLADTHEIASHTYYHSSYSSANLLRSRVRLEEITHKKIYGLRMPRMRATCAKSVLDAGYAYDASIHPTWLPGRYNNLHLSRLPYIDQELWRIPASVTPKWRIPLFWLSFKCFPFSLYKEFALRTLTHDGHLSLYFHPWEFTDLKGSGLPLYTRLICGDRLVERLINLINVLSKYGTFTTMASFAKNDHAVFRLDSLKNNSLQEITSQVTTQGNAFNA
ncbi:MAG: polysaccharide deacetylase family protein [Sphingobacteriales bacterium]|jgi:hypothetical protein